MIKIKNINITQTIRTAAKKAETMAKEAKEYTSDFAQKAEQKAESLKQGYMRVFEKSKVEKLNTETNLLKLRIALKQNKIKKLNTENPEELQKYYERQKELLKLNNKLSKKTEEYNKFVAQQNACQAACDRLNNQ